MLMTYHFMEKILFIWSRVATELEGFCLSNVFSLTIAYNKGPLSK